ncbi:glycosyltransferase family protein [Azospirillum sp. Marseille-Q6669]
MRLALHNPFGSERATAERELAARMTVAGTRRGWVVRIVHSATEIESFAPDLVVALHHEAPKATPHTTLGCLWNPPQGFEDDPQTLARVLSYDGFLTAGDAMRRFVDAHLFPTHRRAPGASLYPTTHAEALAPRIGPESRLFYVGSNWDGRRFERLFGALAQAGVLAAFGPRETWSYLRDGYAGPLAFDGRALLETANRCGIGLCLHLPGHTAAGIPNMRVFELAAAGALMICGRHPFIEEHFSDAVLMVDAGSAEAVAEAIVGHVRWAREHPAVANAMAARAQSVFLERFTLDHLMSAWPDLVEEARNASRLGPSPAEGELVQFVLPVDGAPSAAVWRTIESVAGQRHPAVGLILAGSAESLDAVTTWAATPALASQTVLVAGAPRPGSAIWAGLRRVEAPWFGVIEPGVELFPNHAASLVATAEKAAAELVYSSAALDSGGSWPIVPAGALRRGELPGDRLDILPAAFLARTRVLDERLLRDPGLNAGAPLYLVRRLAARTSAAMSGLTTVRAARTTLDAEERLHLERLERLDAELPAGPGPVRPRPAPASDAGATILADVPLLHEAADFAALDPERAVYIYGSSRGGRLVQLELMKHPQLRIAGFLDSTAAGEAWELPVHHLAEVPSSALASATIVVASQHVVEIVDTLKRLGSFAVFNAYPYIATYTMRC